GSVRLEAPDGAYDRFVSAYVLDLLSEDDITLLIGEARRVLGTEGPFASPTSPGATLFSQRRCPGFGSSFTPSGRPGSAVAGRFT
ncbi:MAG TPA: class I SAM-dependent methyltransferase, partial [Alphaproteobacteria bacterium]|nr:class I SAM-dependent methyltransferase [Alphaproteobacteria bacterium]